MYVECIGLPKLGHRGKYYTNFSSLVYDEDVFTCIQAMNVSNIFENCKPSDIIM